MRLGIYIEKGGGVGRKIDRLDYFVFVKFVK